MQGIVGAFTTPHHIPLLGLPLFVSRFNSCSSSARSLVFFLFVAPRPPDSAFENQLLARFLMFILPPHLTQNGIYRFTSHTNLTTCSPCLVSFFDRLQLYFCFFIFNLLVIIIIVPFFKFAIL